MKKCFVCEKEITETNSFLNHEVNLRVCSSCKGSEEEKKKIQEYLDSLAEGFVCGCI